LSAALGVAFENADFAPPNHNHSSMMVGDEHMKKSRGRPKGTKNKPGHKAGRPRKSGNQEEEQDDEDVEDGQDTVYVHATAVLPCVLF
jgi:hypothetical protein